MRFELDRAVRVSEGGRLLAGGTPPRLLRLSERGARALARVLAGEEKAGVDQDGAATTRALARRGLVAPVPPGVGAPAVELTTVVPVRDGGPELGALVTVLRERGEVIVVDDRSTDGSAELAAAAGARVLANEGAPGPAGARNTGLRAAAGELVAFVDADCRPEVGWSDGLAALMVEDPELVLVGPRVRSAPGAGMVARYERPRSPLDLGPDPSLVGPGNRVGYLPAAALVGRREALLEVDGFAEELRYGEDVDLVWRLVGAGKAVRYVPQVEVSHLPRPDLPALVRQRRGYGGSAVALDARHPGAASPLRAGSAAYLTWLGALRGPGTAAAALALGVARTSRGSEHPASRRALAAIGVRGQAEASLHLARAMSREWLPLTAAALIAGGRARRFAALALAVDALWLTAGSDDEAAGASGGRANEGDGSGAPSDRALAAALRPLDNAAYAAGLWSTAIRARAAGALLPRLT